MLKVIQCTMGGNSCNADFLRPLLAKMGMVLVTISEWPQHDVLWKLDTWLDELAKADIIICVQRTDVQPAKSNGRCTQGMALGKPVCASPLQAYKEAITDGVNGFICNNIEDWEAALTKLKDPELREKIGKAARESVQKAYSMDVIGRRWATFLDRLSREACQPPEVSIIIPTWKNEGYLEECLKSIQANTACPHQVIVINSEASGVPEWSRKYPEMIVENHPTRLHFSSAINRGIRLARAPYLCLLNDDVVVADGWMSALLHEARKPGMGAVNPWSNCDKGWLHNDLWTIDGIDLHPGMTIEEVRPILPKIYSARRAKKVTDREWLAFYCTVIPREAMDKVGLLDEEFKSGGEDREWCHKASQLGYRFVTSDDSVVWHAGGATRKNSERASFEQHHLEDRQNMALLQKKMTESVAMSSMRGIMRQEGVNACGTPVDEVVSTQPPTQPEACPIGESGVAGPAGIRPRLIFFTGAGWEHWSPKSINNGGIGGSETCTAYTAKEFARRNYEVLVYGDPGPDAGLHDGVNYLPWQEWRPSVPCDIFISSRRADVFAESIQARKKICVVHDIFLSPDPKADLHLNNVDRFFVLSPWHQEFFCSHHGVPKEKTYVTRDAIDHSRFAKSLPRVRGRMVYSSSPDRGLDVLLDCLPKIRKRVPEAHLRIFYGFGGWQKAIEARKNPHELAWMNRIKEMMKQPGVEYIGRIGQDRLAEEFLQAELWAQPTAFTETFCVTSAEVMAAGVPVVTTSLAALDTTVGNAGIRIPGDNRSECYQNAFVDACSTVLTDYGLWCELSKRGRIKSAAYRWDTLVVDWIREIG